MLNRLLSLSFGSLVVLSLCATVVSCGKKSNKHQATSGVGVTGQLIVKPTTFRATGLEHLVPEFLQDTFNAQSTTADKVAAVPMYSNLWNYLGGQLANSMVTADVAADGSFNLQFPDTTNPYLVVAYDSTNTNKYESVVGVITMAAVVESLVKMPVDKADGEINLGKAESNGDQEFRSENSVEEIEAVREVKGTLNEMAKVDRSSLHMKNAFVNSSSAEAWIAQPYHSFSGDILLSRDTFISADKYSYDGHGIYFSSNTTDLNIDKICGAKANVSAAQKLEVVPPTSVTLKVRSFTTWPPVDVPVVVSTYDNLDTGPIQTSGSRQYCGNVDVNDYSHGGLYFYKDSQNGVTSYGWNWGGGAKTGPMPEGKFTLKIDGKERAAFELASASPVNSDNSIGVYVPLLKATLNSSGVISGIDVKFVTYNSTSKAYEVVTDTATLTSVIGNLMVGVGNWGSACGQSGDTPYMDKTEAAGVFTFSGMESKGFKLPSAISGYADSTTCTAHSISVSYTMNYNTYHFSLRPIYE